MTIARIFAAKRRMVPKEGYNLVGVDTCEREPEDQLYLIGHYPTEEAAIAAQKTRKQRHSDEVTYVYGPNTR